MAASAADPQDSVTLVRLQIVDADLNKTLSSIRLVKAELASIGTNVASSSAQATTGINNQATALKNATTSARAYADALKQANTGLPSQFIGQGSNLGSAGGSPDLGRIGSELRKLPSIQIPGTGVGTDAVANFIRLGGAAQGLGVALGTLLPVVGLVAVGVGAVVLAFKAFSDGIEASRKVLAQALDAQDKYYGALKENTTSQVDGQIDTLKRGQAAINAQIAENQGAINRARQNVSNDTGLGPLGNVFADIATSQLREKVASLTDEYNANQQVVGRLTEGVKEGTFAINDRIEAEKKLAEVNRNFQSSTFDLASSNADALRKKIADLLNQQQLNINEANDPNTSVARQQELGGTNGIIQTNSSLALIAESFLKIQERADAATDSIKYQSESSQQLQSLLDKTTEDYNHQQAVLSGLKASGLAGDGTLKLLSDSIATDAALIQDLTAKYLPLAVARENEAEALKNQTKAAEDTAKFQKEAAQIAADALEKIGQIKSDLAESEAKIQASTNKELATLAAKYGVDAKRAQEDLNDALKKLRAEAANDQLTDIQDRNAVALDRSQRDEKLKESEDIKAADKEAKRRKEDYDTAIMQLAKANEKQLADARSAAAKQIANTQAAAVKETAVKQQALDDQLKALNIFAPAATGTFNGVLNTMLNGVKYLDAQVKTIIASTTAATGGLSAAQAKAVADAAAADSASGYPTLNFQGNTYIPNPAFSRALPSHAAGLNYVPYDNYIARLHKGERIIPANRNRAMSDGGINFAPVIQGMTRQQIERELVRKVRVFVKGLEPA